MNVSTRWSAPALFVALLLSACASPSPAPVLLTLPPAVTTATLAPPAPTASAPMLAVRRVAIPEYLVARRVRYRADAATLAEWPNTYWAERIEIGVSREFVSALRQQLPGWSLCDTDCGEQVPRLTLTVELVPMDYARSAQKLSARARITVSSAGAAPQIVEKAYELPSSGDNAQGQAQAITELIRQVAAAAAPLVRTSPR